MTIAEFGKENEKTFMLLPGTSCTWEINFRPLAEPLAEQFRVLCVNYTGFGSGDTEVFDSLTAEAEKIEKYVEDHHGGELTAVYGSSMGGNLASLLVQRKKISIEHVYIGSSDLNHASPLNARIRTLALGRTIGWVRKNPEKAAKMLARVSYAKGMDNGDISSSGISREYLLRMIRDYIEMLGKLDVRNIKNQYYSDRVTKVEKGISAPGTTVHVFCSRRMGEKYLRRYYRHYAAPDILTFNSGHEGWLGDPKLMIRMFNRSMNGDYNTV